jgi:hypothetical protein
MRTNTKILVGVGAIALAYYFFKGWNPLAPPKGNNSTSPPKQGQSLPPKSEPKTKITDTTYILNQDFSQRFPIGLSGSGGVTFKKGQYIEATTNPYARNSNLYTTTKGQLPNFKMVGETWIELPSNILTKAK